MGNDILVFVEQREGKILPASLQLMTAAKELAGGTGGAVTAGLIGSGVDALAAIIAQHGAAKVYLADDIEPSVRSHGAPLVQSESRSVLEL